MAGKKSTKAEYNERLSYTAELIGKSLFRYQIVEELQSKYDISIAMCDKYIGEVYQSIKENYKDIGEELMTQYQILRQKAMENNDYFLAKQITDSIAKLTVLKEQKIDITTAGQPISVIKIVEVIKDNNGTES